MVQIHLEGFTGACRDVWCCCCFFFVCWILSILVQITADEEQYWYEMRYPSDISGFVSYIR